MSRHSARRELGAPKARMHTHHLHESGDLRQTLMFGKDVCGVVFARDLEEEEFLGFDTPLLQ